MGKETTGFGLSADEAFEGLVDYGLFSDVIPPCFTSKGLSGYVPNDLLALLTECEHENLRKLLDKRSHDFIRYGALRKANIPRQMGIPHPESYIAQCLVLKRFWDEIKSHCAKPDTPVSRIFVQRTSKNRIFLMNYKGARRFEDEETDIFNKMSAHYIAISDISACFPSIYTHSIPWALHGRMEGKTNRLLSSFGNLLDKVTQGTRDGQTNGLIVGPHASNVVSEIILTSVDHNLIKKGYTRFSRHVDDYKFYAETHEEAENFIRDLGLYLREYELTLNVEKTEILSMPRPSNENWVRELKSFQFPEGEINFTKVSLLLDLALNLARLNETYAVLNYAIQMVPDRLNERAKRLFTMEAVNLALAYPYLAPLLDKHVFCKHEFDGVIKIIQDFVDRLITIGIQKLYPDAIAYALHYSLKYDVQIQDIEFKKIIDIDDCVANVLLLEYAKRHGIKKIVSAITKKADTLKGTRRREKDRYWLLIYQVWEESTLKGEGQKFLAALKRDGFAFIDV